MEIVTITEYQDIYRIKGGVLLVVNKYKYDESYGEHCWLWRAKDRPYHKQTKELRILKEDTNKEEYNSETRKSEVKYIVPKGTVTRHGFPVKLTDKSNWKYEIKTTGDCFNGTCEDMLKYIDEIKKMIIA